MTDWKIEQIAKQQIVNYATEKWSMQWTSKPHCKLNSTLNIVKLPIALVKHGSPSKQNDISKIKASFSLWSLHTVGLWLKLVPSSFAPFQSCRCKNLPPLIVILWNGVAALDNGRRLCLQDYRGPDVQQFLRAKRQNRLCVIAPQNYQYETHTNTKMTGHWSAASILQVWIRLGTNCLVMVRQRL